MEALAAPDFIVGQKNIYTYLLYIRMNSVKQTTAYLRGRCLFHAAMFFQYPCAEFWLALSRLSEAFVLYDRLVFSESDEAEKKSTIFSQPFLNKCKEEGVIQIIPHSEISNQESWLKAFDRFAAGMNEALPEGLDQGTLIDLINDAAGRFAVEAHCYTGLAHALRTDRNIYYERKDTPSGVLRDIAMEIGLHSLIDTLGLSLVDDPLLELKHVESYSRGIAQRNYESLRKIVSDDLANLLKKRDIFSLHFSPIAHIALERAVHSQSDFFDEIMKLRKDLSQYRMKMAEMESIISETASIGEALELRYKWVEQIQAALKAYWAKRTRKILLIESIDASIEESGDVTISLGGLIKLIMHDANARIIRSRARPLFDLLDHIRGLNMRSELFERAFKWCPSRQNQNQVMSIYGIKNFAIESSDYMEVARNEFLNSHGKYGLENRDETIEDRNN